MGEYRLIDRTFKRRTQVFVRHACKDHTTHGIHMATDYIDGAEARRVVLGPTDRLRLIAWLVKNNFHGKHSWATKR